jgi:flagellar basal body P-ring protein FlgI
MSEDKEKKEYWVDDNLNPVFDKDFKKSIDDESNWGMVNEIQYSAIVEKNYEVTDQELSTIKVYLSSLKDFDRLNELAKVITKNEDRSEILENLYKETTYPKTFKEKLYKIYDEDYKIQKDFINIHVETDQEEFFSNKNREDKLEKLLSNE